MKCRSFFSHIRERTEVANSPVLINLSTNIAAPRSPGALKVILTKCLSECMTPIQRKNYWTDLVKITNCLLQIRIDGQIILYSKYFKSTQILVFVFNFSKSNLVGLLFGDLGLQSANYLATVNILTWNNRNQLTIGGWASFRRGGLEPHLFRTLLNLTV